MRFSKPKCMRESIRLTAAAVFSIAAVVALLLELSGVPFGSFSRRFVPASAKDADYVKIMDVGQGDSILIYSNGRSAVIDTGEDGAANAICADLSRAGIQDLDALLLTHLHTDHFGGVVGVLDRYTVKNLILPELLSENDRLYAVKEARNAVIRSGGSVYTAVQGMNFNIGEFEITVLAYNAKEAEENNKSIVTMARIGDLKFLFMGDAEMSVEEALLEEGINVDCDVLKVGHHGSKSSSWEDFLKAASPSYAAVSVGKDNAYFHPSPEVLQKLSSCNTGIFRTDRNGDITFYVENGAIRVETEKGN